MSGKWAGGYQSKVTPATRKAVMSRDNHQCRRCGSTKQLEIDHIVEQSMGGGDDTSNLQVLCRKCHWIKTQSFIQARKRHWASVKERKEYSAAADLTRLEFYQ